MRQSATASALLLVLLATAQKPPTGSSDPKDQRLEHLVRQYYLLRLSHDRLEQELIGRPMSMRDALSTLQEVGSTTQGPEALLRLLAQYCQLETAGLYAAVDDRVHLTPLASLGAVQPALKSAVRRPGWKSRVTMLRKNFPSK